MGSSKTDSLSFADWCVSAFEVEISAEVVRDSYMSAKEMRSIITKKDDSFLYSEEPAMFRELLDELGLMALDHDG